MNIKEAIKDRILILDGAMGTMIQDYRLSNEDFKGVLFKAHPTDLKGDNDILSLTQPHIIKEIHKCEIRCANCHLIKTGKQLKWFKSNFMLS